MELLIVAAVVLALIVVFYKRKTQRQAREAAWRKAETAEDLTPQRPFRGGGSAVRATDDQSRQPGNPQVVASSKYPGLSIEIIEHPPERPQPAPHIGGTGERERSLSGRRFRIKYISDNGELSDRVVKVSSVESSFEQVYLNGFCETKKEDRQFRSDRIIEMVDHDSGDIINSPAAFIGWFTDGEVRGAGYDTRNWQKIRPGVTVLAWLAQSDGRTSESEIEMLLDYADERLLQTAAYDPANKSALRYFILSTEPSLSQALAACRTISKTKKESKLVLDFLARMKGADGEKSEAWSARQGRLISAINGDRDAAD